MKILGMMSGTSGDGIDGALVEFSKTGDYRLLWHKSYDFSDDNFVRIQKLMKNCSSVDVILGNAYISDLYAKAYYSFLVDSEDKPDFIAAHGQTVWHQPTAIRWDGIDLRGTLQLLDAPLLAQRTGIPVINNFRSADMAVGGQGAPLVPFSDLKVFGSLFPEDCIVLNIGGMANITAIHKKNNVPDVVCAFDTGPGNVLSDSYMQSKKLGKYDQDGILASKGKSIKKILGKIMEDPYFKLPFPKSTGREHFNSNILEIFINQKNHSDCLSTILDVTVLSILEGVKLIRNHISFPCKMIIAGGGAKNIELINRLRKALNRYCTVYTSDQFGIPVMAREAMAFSILGHAFINKEFSNIPCATGAKKQVILGQLSPI